MVLAPLLIVTGIAGFLIPQQYSLMSGEPPYNMFHLIFGALGLVLISSNSNLLASVFNFGFGLIDLYQVVASVVAMLASKDGEHINGESIRMDGGTLA